MDWVEAYRATLAPFVRTINVVNRGDGVYYIEAHDQNRLLGYRRVSAQLLNEYGAQARELAIRARDAGLQPANVLPGLAAIARLPATDECERQAEVDLLSGR